MAVIKDQLEAQKGRTSLDSKGWNDVKGIMNTIKPPVNTTSPAPRVAPLPGFPDQPKPQPGGATTNLNAAYRDSGTWTLKPVFGLVYPMM
jgi:hypothetical protein